MIAHVHRRGVAFNVAWLLRAEAFGAHGARKVFRQDPARVEPLKRRLVAPHALQEKRTRHRYYTCQEKLSRIEKLTASTRYRRASRERERLRTAAEGKGGNWRTATVVALDVGPPCCEHTMVRDKESRTRVVRGLGTGRRDPLQNA